MPGLGVPPAADQRGVNAPATDDMFPLLSRVITTPLTRTKHFSHEESSSPIKNEVGEILFPCGFRSAVLGRLHLFLWRRVHTQLRLW
jgi:hypothetical protein